MKRLIHLFTVCVIILAAISSCYNDSALKSDIADLKERVSSLEEQMRTANGNISALQTAVRALENKVYVTSVTKAEDGYVIVFSDNTTATIKDGRTPVIGADKHQDVYYWTVDGEWLLDRNGKMLPVTGTAPELKIEGDNWYISVDGGGSWTGLGQATGDSLFKSVEDSDLYVILTLADGTVLKLPKSDIMDILKKVQSIQYVPDYDDGKITVNSAIVYHGTDAVLFDQPTEITYQILPAQYASKIAQGIKATNDFVELFNGKYETGLDIRALLKELGFRGGLLAWFDVREVNTRAGGGTDGLKYWMKILEITSADDSTGEVTFKVLPVNVASESFIASGLKPRYDVGLTDHEGYYIRGWNPSDYLDSSGIFRAEDPLYPERTYSIPVWTLPDLQAWQGRSAFAVQLRLYQFQDCEVFVGEDGAPGFIDYENELASPYTTLYPNVMDPIELLPGAYVPGAYGYPERVDASGAHQYLPYNVLRGNGGSSEPGYRVILDGLTPAFVIDGKTVSAQEAYNMGYVVYGTSVEWDSFTYSSPALEDLVVGTGQVYAEVEMNPGKSEAERKAAVGGTVTGKYVIRTPFGDQTVSGTVEITDPSGTPGPGPGPDVPGPDASYNFLHLKYYTFNSRQEGQTMQKLDFDTNDGSVVWWTRCYPAYYTTLPSAAGTTPAGDNRISNRFALADYNPAPLNFAELSFNVVDAEDNIMDEAALQKEGIEVVFDYADASLNSRSLPQVCQTGGLQYYMDLWTGNTTFLYRTNEMPFIPITARLLKHSGSGTVELPTRFTAPKASVKYPSEMLDYSSFAVVPWVPFDNLEGGDFRVVLDEHKVYRVPLGQNLELQDQRPNNVSFYVIKDGEWVIGDVDNPEGATSQSGGNGYVSGIRSKEAYQLGDLVYDIDAIKAALPVDLRRLVSIVYSTNGLDFFTDPIDGSMPYLSIDYTSQITFGGTIRIPVHVELPNPWQSTLETDYTIYISGINN